MEREYNGFKITDWLWRKEYAVWDKSQTIGIGFPLYICSRVKDAKKWIDGKIENEVQK